MSLLAIRDQLAPLITAGVVGTCTTLDSEALYSTRSPAEYEQVRADRRAAYEYLPTNDGHWQQAPTFNGSRPGLAGTELMVSPTFSPASSPVSIESR